MVVKLRRGTVCRTLPYVHLTPGSLRYNLRTPVGKPCFM